MSKFETSTTDGVQERIRSSFRGNTTPATVEEIANVYAALVGVVDVFLATHRVMVELPLTIEQREVFDTATNDMNVLIDAVWRGMDALGKRD